MSSSGLVFFVDQLTCAAAVTLRFTLCRFNQLHPTTYYMDCYAIVGFQKINLVCK